MSDTVLVPTANNRTHAQANWSINLATKKAALAMQKATAAAAAAESSRKRVYDEMIAASAQQQAVAAAPSRTSTKAFAAKSPRHGLAVLQCIDLTAITKQEYAQLDMVAYKYNVHTLSEVLATGEGALYKSARAASMMAATATRYVFEVACELAAGSEEDAGGQRALVWHTPQSMLKRRETRGAGVVTNSDAAMALLKKALVVATERVKERVDAADKYEQAMSATAAAVVA